MDIIENIPWERESAVAIGIVGLLLFWRGLLGGPGGERGLIRRRVPMLDQLEYWRTTLVGLTLTGLGAAWFWDLSWLLVLSLGIGFVEIHEATHVIKAWRWSGSATRDQQPSAARAVQST